MSPVFFLLLAACSGSKGDPGSFEHCGELTTDETWVEGVHAVTCDVVVSGAHLAIEAGVEVRFDEGTSLNVTCDADAASLAVEGTAEAPVLFTASNGIIGSWEYLRLCEGTIAESTVLRHLRLEKHGAYDNTTPRSGLVILDAEVLAEHVQVDDGEGVGVYLRGGTFAPGSTMVSATGNVDAPLLTTASSMTSIPGDGSFTGNGADEAWLWDGELRASGTLAALDVPWYFEEGLDIGGDSAPAVLTVEAGAVLLVARSVQVGASGRQGGLRVTGTADAPVRLEPHGTQEPGEWDGLVFHPDAVDADSIVEHADIGWARRGVSADDASPTLRDVRIHDSEECAIRETGDAAVVVEDLVSEDNPADYCE